MEWQLTIGFCLMRSRKSASGNPEKTQARPRFPRLCRGLKDLVMPSTGLWISMLTTLLMTAINAAMTVFLAYCLKKRRPELQFARQAARHEISHPRFRSVHIMTERYLAEVACFQRDTAPHRLQHPKITVYITVISAHPGKTGSRPLFAEADTTDDPSRPQRGLRFLFSYFADDLSISTIRTLPT